MTRRDSPTTSPASPCTNGPGWASPTSPRKPPFSANSRSRKTCWPSLSSPPSPAPTGRKKKDELLEELKVTHLSKQKAYTLSGGERRRVEIARALVLQPHFILLDEPFVGIDPIAVQDIQGIIRFLKKKKIGILITDHNVRETLSIVDRAYIMFEGRILLSGTAAKLASNKQAKEIYLGERFSL